MSAPVKFRVLIVEDSKKRVKVFKEKLIGHELVIVDNPGEAIKLLTDKEWDYLFLDHDLLPMHYAMLVKGSKGIAPGTGSDVSKWLAKNPERGPTKMVIIHSLNPIGSQKMYDHLNGVVKCEVKKEPFAWENIK